jgi:hypothetical protein
LKKGFVLISLCCLLAALLGCGGSNSTIVFISPSSATVKTGATLQFTANVPVSWSVTGNAAIDSAGLFRAGNTTGNVTVTAVARDGSGSSGTAVVAINTTGTATTTTIGTPSGIKHRVFVSNTFSGVLNIVDADSDLLVLGHAVSLGTGSVPTFMLQTPDQTAEAVYDSFSKSFWLVSNATEAFVANRPLAGPLTSAASAAIIPGGTAVYAAVPTATLPNAVPGAVYRADFATSGYLSVAIQGARFLSMDHNAVNMLVFSKDSDTVTLVTSTAGTLVSNTGTLTAQALPSVAANCAANCFSRPVAAVFSADDSTAYVLSSGPVNGGTQPPMVTVLDMTQTPPAVVKTLNVDGANVGLLQGTTLSVAGAAIQACSSGSGQCQQGVLTVIDTTANTAGAPVPFGPDAPSLMPGVLTSDGTNLWIGSTGCQVSDGAPGCLSRYLPGNSVGSQIETNSLSSTLTPPSGDDVTGMVWLQPFNGRKIMYVIEGGELLLYDNTFANVVVQGGGTNIVVDIVGQASDIKAAK